MVHLQIAHVCWPGARWAGEEVRTVTRYQVSDVPAPVPPPGWTQVHSYETRGSYPLTLPTITQSIFSCSTLFASSPTHKCSAIKGPLLFSGGWERRISPGCVLQPVISPRPRLISAIRLLTGLTGLQRAGGAGDQVTLSPDSEQSLHQHSPRTQCTSIFLL